MALLFQGLIGGLVHRLLAAGHVARKIDDIPALCFRQGLPRLLINLSGPPAARIRDDDADRLDLSPGPLGRAVQTLHELLVADHASGRGQFGAGVLALEDVFALRGIGRVLRDEELEADAAIRLVQQRALPVRQQHDEAQEGIPQRLINELELEPLHRHHPPQIHLNPPLLNGIARVRLPERGGVAVENIGREPRIGPHSADTGPHPIVKDQLVERIPYRLAKHVELHGAVDGADARVGLADDDRTLESGIV